ncbi:glycosyltransferase family 4 protein [bacterium]|nr:glycosyltransferase family 4 protein [candidate division CSSED10-310 bacterium]
MDVFKDIISRRTRARPRVLVLGMCPLPTENEFQTLGPGKRTWQFVRAMLDHDFEVCLISSRHPAAFDDGESFSVAANEENDLIHYMVNQRVFEEPRWIQSIHDHFQPDCVVGATVFPSYVACRIETKLPVWADLFGHTMAEAQTKCQVFEDDYYIYNFWRMEKLVLDRADAYSVVSNPQKFATIGELGTRGRLNRRTFDYPFVRVVPCAVQFSLARERGLRMQNLLRSGEVNDDDFVVLWSGGYNTWTDVVTLFTSLERAMEVNPRIRFVSTGGEIGGHDDITYPQFQRLIRNSRFRDRFILKGWIPHHQVPSYWAEADIGINIDKMTYEAVLGSRNRILDWMGVGLPVLTTKVCELSEIIEHQQLGLTFSPGDSGDLTRLLLWASDHKIKLNAMADRARGYAIEHFSIHSTTAPLITWIETATPTPDRNTRSVPVPQLREPKRIKQSHYLASLRNQLRIHGPLNTAKWLVNRTFLG